MNDKLRGKLIAAKHAIIRAVSNKLRPDIESITTQIKSLERHVEDNVEDKLQNVSYSNVTHTKLGAHISEESEHIRVALDSLRTGLAAISNNSLRRDGIRMIKQGAELLGQAAQLYK